MRKPLRTALSVSLIVIMALMSTVVFASSTKSTVYMNTEGEGKLAVIFDSGYGDGVYVYSDDSTVETWGKVRPGINGARTVEYDRIGLGQSPDQPNIGKTAMDRAHQLHYALKSYKIKGPYIYVAHSLAGFTARAFAAEYKNEVYGAVFVDCTGVGEPEYDLDYFEHNMPDTLNEFLGQFTEADGKWNDVLTSENQIKDLNGLKDKPLTIISTSKALDIPYLDTGHVNFQAEQLKLSMKSKQIIVDSSHYIMLYGQSSVITNAINEMIESYKCRKK